MVRTSGAILTASFVFFSYLVLRAFLQLDLEGYDFLYYHLPFALKMYGKTTYQLFPWLEDLYQAYPPLAHAVQGFLVWTTGYFPLANSIGAIAVLILLATIHLGEKRNGTAGYFLLAFLSVPLLVRHVSIGLIDLWLGCFLALSFYCYYKWETEKRFAWLWRLGIFLAVACYSKYQAWPIAVVILASLLVGTVWSRNHRATALVVAIGLCCAGWPILNWLRFSNPSYPYPFPFASDLPSTVDLNRIANRFMPPWLVPYPRPVRFVISFLELSRFNLSVPQMIWTNASWQPGERENFHYKLGGLSMVSIAILLLAVFIAYKKRLMPKATAIVFAVAVGVVSILPQSHELRYWLFIPLVLCFFFSRLMTEESALPVLFRGRLQAALACSALFTIACNQCFRLDLRPLVQRAPEAAVAYWRRAANLPDQKAVEIHAPMERAIFWSGPDFNTYRVVLPEHRP
jgi:4-amino-4-deoxy-L-arabinose transferase-like glycosyltransferase